MRCGARALALLTLVSCGGDKTPTQPVTPVATSIELSSPSVTLESLGATSALTATVKDQTGAAMTGQTISWSSSDVTIAAVSNGTASNGTVTAIANGSATVTATSGSARATLRLGYAWKTRCWSANSGLTELILPYRPCFTRLS